MSTRMTIGSGVIYGSGMPTGTAPVGTVYVDTAATNGAVRWVYTPNGWQVEAGDTGTRDLTGSMNPITGMTSSASGVCLFRRVGSLVTFFLQGLAANPALGATDIISTPMGFRPARNAYARTYWDNAGYVTGAVVHLSAIPVGGEFWTTTYPTADAWPDPLPGNAV